MHWGVGPRGQTISVVLPVSLAQASLAQMLLKAGGVRVTWDQDSKTNVHHVALKPRETSEGSHSAGLLL